VPSRKVDQPVRLSDTHVFSTGETKLADAIRVEKQLQFIKSSATFVLANVDHPLHKHPANIDGLL
jgi:hypothetical protein